LADSAYTKYGTIQGSVVEVSNNAKQDDQKNWVFTTEIALEDNGFYINGSKYFLTRGMTVEAEVKTGRQSILRYLLTPLIRTASESFHER
jgi:hemolysin D